MVRRALVGAVALATLVLAGCSGSNSSSSSAGGPTTGSSGSATGATGTLRLFAYSDAFDPEVFNGFVEANPDLKIQKAEIAGDTEAVAKLKGGFQTDIVNTCAGPIDKEIANGSLQPIDTSRIKDWDKVYPFFKGIKGVDVNGDTYMLPLVGGAYGLAYRPSAFDTPPTSWMDLFTTDKRVTEPDDPLTSIISAALALGYNPPQDMTSDQLAKVQQLLEQQKSHVVTYYQGSSLPTLWRNGEVDITPTDVTLVNQLKGQDVAFAPMNPPLAWTCGYSIAKDAQNLDAAYAFLNYALSPAVQKVQAEKFSYLVSNKQSAKELSKAVRDKSGQNNVGDYSDAATFGLPKDYSAWEDVWQNVKS
jgi:spermidine/putrescine transport system substrate-binding protein